MSVSIRCLAQAAGACVATQLLATAAAHADFQAALREYQAGHYETAHAQFLTMAELGDCSSQYNLAAMALQGQGGPKDRGAGVGWLEAAAGNGCRQLVGERLPRLEASLDVAEAHAAAEILGHFGPDALHAQGVLNPELECRDRQPARVLEAAAPEYPINRGDSSNALVITRLTIGVDGLARDPEILMAVPEHGFAAAAVESWLNARFAPAMADASAVESRLEAKLVFARRGGATLAEVPTLRQARAAAEAGDPQAEYRAGLAAMLDPSLGIPSARAGQLVIGAARDGTAEAQYWLGSELRATVGCHPRADGTVWLQHAAAGGSATARLVLASDLLAHPASSGEIGQARALLAQAAASDSYYVRKHVVALLAASPIEAVRAPRAALELARQLAAGEIQSDPQMFEAVAAAYAANGDFRNAVAAQQTATAKAAALGWNVRPLSERLAAYRAGRAWSGDLLALAPLAGKGP
jgi:uncharacterized protein